MTRQHQELRFGDAYKVIFGGNVTPRFKTYYVVSRRSTAVVVAVVAVALR